MTTIHDHPQQVIPVGIDLSSFHTRIAFMNLDSSFWEEEKEYPNSISSPSSSLPSIVSNELGDRYTLAMYAVEDDQNPDGSLSFLFGDAARRILHRHKLDTHIFSIQHVLKQDSLQTNSQNDQQQENNDQQQQVVHPSEAMIAFFQHLITLTCHATHNMFPSTLRLVISIPVSLMNHTRYLSNIHTSVQQGLIQTMRAMGYDNHPFFRQVATTYNHHNNNMNKKEKKKKIQELEIQASQECVQFITEPIAILAAHGYLFSPDLSTNTTIRWVQSPILSFQSSSPNNNSMWKYALILDWGASSFKISLLQNIPFHTTCTSSTSSSPIISIHTHEEYTQYSGHVLSDLLVQHVAQTFQNTYKIRGESILDNRKIHSRIQVAVEQVVRTFCKGTSNQAWITLDGLYQGLDCHMAIPAQRWDLLMSSVLNTVEVLLLNYRTQYENDSMIVLTSGCMVCHPTIMAMIDRIFDPTRFSRGKSRDIIPPEEAVAMGCSIYSNHVSSSPWIQRLLNHHEREEKRLVDKDVEEKDENLMMDDEGKRNPMVIMEDIHVSPVCVAWATTQLGKEQVKTDIVIPIGSPLPCYVVYSVENVNQVETISLIQLQDKEDTSGKVLCRLDNLQSQIHASSSSLDITVILSTHGELSVAIQDQVPVIIK